jgi:serine protease
VDTGVAADHPDLESERISGFDMKDKGWFWNEDGSGHGTHVAGTIAAVAGNGQGVQGVGSFDLYVVRALGEDATGYESDIFRAVQKCIDVGAHVINLSLGTLQLSEFASDMYSKAVEEHGIIMVAAAGNTADNTYYYPASHPSVISVGATDTFGTRFFSSVYNDQIELVAPGEKILSTTVSTHSIRMPDGFAFPAQRVVGVADRVATGKLAYCELGSSCSAIEDGGICLYNVASGVLEQAGISLEEALIGCRESGGVGAVFFNEDKPVGEFEDMYIDGYDLIPAICVSKGTALDLISRLESGQYPEDDGGMIVTIGDAGDDNAEYVWDVLSGTSMACPHVSASAALLKSHFFNCSNHQIRYSLTRNALHPAEGCNTDYGYGIVQVKDAYDWLEEQGGCDDWDVLQISRGGCTTIDESDLNDILQSTTKFIDVSPESADTGDGGGGDTSDDDNDEKEKDDGSDKNDKDDKDG